MIEHRQVIGLGTDGLCSCRAVEQFHFSAVALPKATPVIQVVFRPRPASGNQAATAIRFAVDVILIDQVKDQIGRLIECANKIFEIVAAILLAQSRYGCFPLWIDLTAVASGTAPPRLRLVYDNNLPD